METIVVLLYIVMVGIFSNNFVKIIKQIKSGSSKVNKYSLIATSSLIFQFASLALYFCIPDLSFILATQIYLLFCMGYIKFSNKKKG